jgi:hypothetical protein
MRADSGGRPGSDSRPARLERRPPVDRAAQGGGLVLGLLELELRTEKHDSGAGVDVRLALKAAPDVIAVSRLPS